MGFLFFQISLRHRRVALGNLSRAMGREIPPQSLYLIARQSFIHFGKVMADTLKWMHLGEKKRVALIEVEGAEHIQEALRAGAGALLFTAHFGNWEVASSVLSRFGRLNVIARPLDNPFLERELSHFRESLGARIISKYQASKPVLQSLRKNEMVALLVDQNVLRSQAVFVDFFDIPAATTPSLASFYLRTKSPLIPLFCSFTPSFSYRLKIGTPLVVEDSGYYKEDVLKITQQCTKMIETEIRKSPAFWFWFHDRWRTRPEKEEGRVYESQ